MHFLVPSVRIEGEVVGEPQTSTVTKVFWGRLALKCLPGALLGYLFLSGRFPVPGLVLVLVLFVTASFFIRPLSDIGKGVLGGIGALLKGLGDVLDSLIGPNKGQVPVQVFNLQVMQGEPQPKLSTNLPTSELSSVGTKSLKCSNLSLRLFEYS